MCVQTPMELRKSFALTAVTACAMLSPKQRSAKIDEVKGKERITSALFFNLAVVIGILILIVMDGCRINKPIGVPTQKLIDNKCSTLSRSGGLLGLRLNHIL
jgi:hypothetical protein